MINSSVHEILLSSRKIEAETKEYIITNEKPARFIWKYLRELDISSPEINMFAKS